MPVRVTLTSCLWALAFSVSAIDLQGKFTTLSMGTKSCGDFVANFNAGGQLKLNNSIWIAGYLTAMNERVAKVSNVAAGTNPEAWDLWMFNFCSAKPLETVGSAASALADAPTLMMSPLGRVMVVVSLC